MAPASYNKEQMELLKNVIYKDYTESELDLILKMCETRGLNPFLNPIYLIKRAGKNTFQISIDGFRMLADRTKRYMPGREPVFTYDKEGNLLCATSFVKKLDENNVWHEVGATAYLNEYIVYAAGDKPTHFWKKMPHNQLAKCAESLALRKAFPADLAGIYTSEEMEQASSCLPSEIISEEEAYTLEKMIGEDREYKEKLLNYFSNKEKKKIAEMKELPKKYYDSCFEAIDKRTKKAI